jgi:hypothetical protein
MTMTLLFAKFARFEDLLKFNSFSDGVGAGQIQEVNDNEVAAIQRVLKSDDVKTLVPDGIKLTFIIVSKRINTRSVRNEKYEKLICNSPIKWLLYCRWKTMPFPTIE